MKIAGGQIGKFGPPDSPLNAERVKSPKIANFKVLESLTEILFEILVKYIS